MNLTIPQSKEYPLEEFLKNVERDISYLDDKYDSAYILLKDAISSAMSWAPQAFMQKQMPDVSKLYNLSVQLLAICYATERMKKRDA